MNEMPHNLAAERSVCTALALDGQRAYKECLSRELATEDFYHTACRLYWELFCAFMVDHPNAESDEIGRENWLREKKITPQEYVAASGPRSTWLEMIDAIREVKRLAFRRRLITGAAKVGEVAATTPEDLPAAVASLSRLPVVDSRPLSFQQLADSQAESMRNPLPEQNLRCIHWPWPSIDRSFKPLLPGELVVLAARPSIGKSSLARQLALYTARSGQSVYFSSLEVNGRDFVDGLVMAASGQPKDNKTEYLAAVAAIRSLPICFDDYSLSLGGISAGARRARERTGLDLLVIDYLGLLAECTPAKGQNKAQAVGDTAGACKRLCKELGCVLLLIAQINRAPVNDDREPRMSDLRDSGDIEAHADRIIILHQPENFGGDDSPARTQSIHDAIEDHPTFFTQIFQEKGRSVGTAAAGFYLKRSIARFDVTP